MYCLVLFVKYFALAAKFYAYLSTIVMYLQVLAIATLVTDMCVLASRNG